MITIRFNNPFALIILVIILAILGALLGCGRSQNMTMEGVSTANTPMPDIATEPPVKMVWFINFPEGGKEAYNDWLASVGETLRAQELVRSRIYDNIDPDMRPHRYVELEFESYLAAATYMNRPEIAAMLQQSTDYATDQTMHTFIERSDYSKGEAGEWAIKVIRLIDYPIGGKQDYLDYVTSVSRTLVEPPSGKAIAYYHRQLKAITAYDNYYGTSPHRLVTLEFASQAEADAWRAHELEEALSADVLNFNDPIILGVERQGVWTIEQHAETFNDHIFVFAANEHIFQVRRESIFDRKGTVSEVD